MNEAELLSAYGHARGPLDDLAREGRAMLRALGRGAYHPCANRCGTMIANAAQRDLCYWCARKAAER